MPFQATVFRVLIASPSDVSAEREIAVRTIQEWNDLNSAERQIVLLPLRWETHSAPEYGKRPQEIINRQVVDQCDLLVGVFWTRIGSPTGAAEGGTVEEIERVAKAGKPVMLYFSQVKEDPEKLDLEQLSKLREFKRKTFPRALVQSYSDHVEFKERLAKQIEIELRELLADQMPGREDADRVRPVTDIVLRFADGNTAENAGAVLELETTFIDVSNWDEIPDYEPPTALGKPSAVIRSALGDVNAFGASSPNRNYYRQKAAALIGRAFFAPVRFWMKNQGGIGARDVYIDLRMRCEEGKAYIAPFTGSSNPEPPKSTSLFTIWSDGKPSSVEETLGREGDSWSTHIEMRALQPQREVSPEPQFMVGAKQDCEILINASIYADTLSEPHVQELTVRLRVTRVEISGRDLFDAYLKEGSADGAAGSTASAGRIE